MRKARFLLAALALVAAAACARADAITTPERSAPVRTRDASPTSNTTQADSVVGRNGGIGTIGSGG